jgi:hypothetical protein
VVCNSNGHDSVGSQGVGPNSLTYPCSDILTTLFEKRVIGTSSKKDKLVDVVVLTGALIKEGNDEDQLLQERFVFFRKTVHFKSSCYLEHVYCMKVSTKLSQTREMLYFKGKDMRLKRYVPECYMDYANIR